MKKSLSLFLGTSLLISSLPLAFAESSSSSAAASLASSSTSSSSSNTLDVRSTFSTRCKDLKGADKVKCSRAAAKDQMKARFRQNPAAEARIEACKEETGLAKAKCLRQRIEATQQQKIDQRMDMRIMKTQNKMMMRMKVNMRGNRSSASSSEQ